MFEMIIWQKKKYISTASFFKYLEYKIETKYSLQCQDN